MIIISLKMVASSDVGVCVVERTSAREVNNSQSQSF